MRRSKSNPAKYARNYRSISSRRMTNKEFDEDKEIVRLQHIIKQSSSEVEQHEQKVVEEESKRKRNKDEKDESANNYYNDEDDDDANDIILLPAKKKKKDSSPKIELTPQEIKRARAARKNATRKLKTLEARANQKKKRAELYSNLRESAITEQERSLLSSSSTLGKRETKRETLRRLLQRERAGVTLTAEEEDILYKRKKEKQIDDDDIVLVSSDDEEDDKTKRKKTKNDSTTTDTTDDEDKSLSSSSKKRKRKKKKKAEEEENNQNSEKLDIVENKSNSEESNSDESDTESEKSDDELDTESDESDSDDEINTEKKSDKLDTSSNESSDSENNNKKVEEASPPPISFAAQMMASMVSLKTETDKTRTPKQEGPAISELERIAIEEDKRVKDSIYVPTNPVLVQTAAQMGLRATRLKSYRRVLQIQRPAEIEKKRYDLPISAMEFEIVDAIRNNNVTILCSETGSGKSTQVPQFLYEAGFTLLNEKDNDCKLIGITQPRRVAAVSTAKRVCYEMGKGDGQTIQAEKKKQGNTVAYHTRYESAGLGNRTRIKFMTDGILLQEIRTDLLLRKYNVIVLDEAHERNLNTDILLGLIGASIQLRKQASQEANSNLGPLKLVVMSATLKVEDFTNNERLFPNSPPEIVRVPGRMYPVTIHHSRVTELDDYENVALQKVTKIHRKLPPGGILVFLTGKQEIVRMVNKLRRRFNKRDAKPMIERQDVSLTTDDNELSLRDLDDDDMDGDVFNENANDDYDNVDNEDEEDIIQEESTDDDNIPKKAIILPLHSMLSVEEQAKVFANVPEDHRLIVVATNIAETSLTIPGISYVVDTGRQKCRNYHAGTGVASYDIMWISKAAADQRAGRAGRTAPGHCYRLYSSALFTRQMEDFALPEVLTRPLEDVVLSMKAMNITHVAKFPFPTPPARSQIDSAVKMLANLGCVEMDEDENGGGDGRITDLGSAVAKLPLGVRYGKMLLVAAQAGVLDYAIVMVALLSENTPFLNGPKENPDDEKKEDDSSSSEDEEEKETHKEVMRKWRHRGGDVLAGVLAVGGYAYAGKGAGGLTEKAACRKFCDSNALSYSVMVRIHKMRLHLARLAKARLSSSQDDGIAVRTGGIVTSMRPPNTLQEKLISQAICSGLLDRVAMLAPPGSFARDDHPRGFRSAYIGCISKEPLFLDQTSAIFTKDFRSLPKWICFDQMIRKKPRQVDEAAMVMMKRVTPIEPQWLGALSAGSRLLRLGEPVVTPAPTYDSVKDRMVCAVCTKFGSKGWEIPSLRVEMRDAVRKHPKNRARYLEDDSFRYFARFLLEGKVLTEFKDMSSYWNDDPAVITRKMPMRKVALLVSALSSHGIDSAGALKKHWAEEDRKFLYELIVSNWTKSEHLHTVKQLWMQTVKKYTQEKKKKKKKRKKKS